MTTDTPDGTVTFLFTDIEGSTRLAQEYPEALPGLLARHHELLRSAIESHNGFIFRIAGDSFSAAFHSAGDALQAALGAQRSLHHEAWSPAPVKVRMGIHTGAAHPEVMPGETRYSGYATLALTQRIMAAGHGGQVLLSRTAHDLAGEALPPQVRLVDMGERSLKDILGPVQLYQLAAPDLPSEFPPLKTHESFNHNLPGQLTSFIGREKELEEVKRLVAADRMVTLTGSGGAGKTRLSLQVGGDCLALFSGGVWLVELAPVADPALVPQTLLSVFKLHEDPNRAPLDVLQDHLRSKTVLLILDNCEHLIETCARIAERLLRACPGLKVLASSREALGIPGEVPYRVPSLQTPDPAHLPPLEHLLEVDSIRLFVERSAAASPGFRLTQDNAASVAQICSRLDGMPLAIELAAARVRALSPEQIASRLDDRFRLLTGGSRTALPRQQTLRAMIDWSYSLLSEPEKRLFRRLAVFTGGWRLEAAEWVCGEEGDGVDVLDLLARLVDKSLIVGEASGDEVRYHRLETIRQYSRERFFETDEVEAVRDRHLAYYIRFSEEVERQLQSPDRKRWAQRSAAEQENVRAAIEWGLAKDPAGALQIATNMLVAITSGGYSVEGFRWLRDGLRAMETSLSAIEPGLRAKAWGALAFIYLSLGNSLQAQEYGERSIDLYRQLGDRAGLASALLMWSITLETQGRLDQAEAALQESLALARGEDNVFLSAWVLNSMARVTARLYGDPQAASRFADEAIRLSREAGIRWQVAASYEVKGVIAASCSRYEEARDLFEQALSAFQEVGAHFNVVLNKSNLAHLERQFGHVDQALERYRESLLAFREVGQLAAVAHQLECFGFLAIARERNERALVLFAAADSLRRKVVSPMTSEEQSYFDEQLAGLREKLEEREFDSIWSRGQALTMDQAIEFALSGQPEPPAYD